jgi:hypothetical protein
MADGHVWKSHTGAAMEVWDLWVPDCAATGLSFARGRIDPHQVLWVHAAPRVLSVTVRDGDDLVIARGDQLERRGEQLPMTRLERVGNLVTRDDRWPGENDRGDLVILPGGEVGTLMAWSHAPDGSEWRWQVEFYNHR